MKIVVSMIEFRGFNASDCEGSNDDVKVEIDSGCDENVGCWE